VRELNRHVFQGPAPAEQQQQRLLVSSCLACQRMAALLDGLWRDTDPVSSAETHTDLSTQDLSQWVAAGMAMQPACLQQARCSVRHCTQFQRLPVHTQGC
jgi:ABC-type phosphate transport system ATPase subunit